MRLLRFALPAVLVLSVLAGGAAAADRDAFLDCVARNTVKYSEPGSSAVAQYVDVEAACRAALDDGPETGFVIVDAEGDRVGGDTGEAAPADSGGSSSSSSSTGEAEGAGGSGDSGASGGSEGTGTTGGSSSGAPTEGAGSRTTGEQGTAAAVGPAPAVASLPASAESVEPLSGTPGWLLALVALGIVAVVATAGLETYRRRRG